MLSYRGYGKSQGSANEAGMKIDAQAALDYIVNKNMSDKIIVYGQSIGGAVAIDLTAKNQGKVDLLIVENTFLSLVFTINKRKLIPQVLPRIPFIKYLCTQVWNSEATITSIELPILFLSGSRDELVPSSHMRGLHSAANGKQLKEFVSFASGTHNDTCVQPGYFEAIQAFWAKVLAKGRGRTLKD